MIAVYFSKPFDSVCHNLLAMLRAYSCQESAIGLYDRLYRTVSRELSPMGFSESIPVEFLKVDY